MSVSKILVVNLFVSPVQVKPPVLSHNIKFEDFIFFLVLALMYII